MVAMASTRSAYCSTINKDTPSRASREKIEDLIDDHGSQSERCLVDEHDLGVRKVGPHERQHLLLAPAERSRYLLSPLGQVRKRLLGAVENVGFRTVSRSLEPKVLAHRQGGEDAAPLHHVANAKAGAAARRRSCDVLPLEPDAALLRAEQP